MINSDTNASSELSSQTGGFDFVQSKTLKIREILILITFPCLTDLLYLIVVHLTTGLKDSVGLGKTLAALAFLTLSLLYLRAG